VKILVNLKCLVCFHINDIENWVLVPQFICGLKKLLVYP